MTGRIDEEFLALPLRAIADAGLARARVLGATHADVRVQRSRNLGISLRDAQVQSLGSDVETGLAVRVLHDGVWGFAAADSVDPATAARLAEQAVALARISAPLATERVELADEPVHGDVAWTSSWTVDPFGVPAADQVGLLADWSTALLAAPGVDHVDASVRATSECTFYADSAGTTTTQQRIWIDPSVTAVTIDAGSGAFESLTTCAPPAGRGWEYLAGSGGNAPAWDWAGELATMPELLTEKLNAPGVQPGRYDLVIDPTNLWLTIHESVGHATELDRALGYEANYAGTSFATPDKLGNLQYGSPHMNITGDRTVEHGLGTVGYDAEGVAAQSWDLVRDGVLVGYQLDRAMARRSGLRSNGCAYADSAVHVPMQRMPNVSLAADPTGPDVAALIASVSDGLYIVGDRSWSIDMQRFNFQFTGQKFFRIRGGRLVGQVRDVAYQSNTLDFWNSMVARGGPSTYVLGGAVNCGKGQPGQVAPVSHGCPAAVFEGVNILNSAEEGAR